MKHGEYSKLITITAVYFKTNQIGTQTTQETTINYSMIIALTVDSDKQRTFEQQKRQPKWNYMGRDFYTGPRNIVIVDGIALLIIYKLTLKNIEIILSVRSNWSSC